MNKTFDDDDTLQALALSDDEFNSEVRSLIQKGLGMGPASEAQIIEAYGECM
jgi:hypothetical protein